MRWGVEGFAVISVVLLEFDDGPRWPMQQQDGVPAIAVNSVDFGQFEQRCPPLGAGGCVTDGNEMCDTLLKLGMEIALGSHLEATRLFGREYVVCLTHHLPHDLGGWRGASNGAHTFAGRIDHRVPITACFGRWRQR